MRLDRPALGMRWLVLLVILFGTIVSTVGGMHSHGIAAIASLDHAVPAPTDTVHDRAHGHSHEDVDSNLAGEGHRASSDHPHHGADHSHDKAHALPVAWYSSAPPLPAWYGHVRPWIEMVQVYRLERPPMG